MFVEVPESSFHALKVGLLDFLVWHAAVHFQRLGGDHKHGGRWSETSFAAFDIVEFLRTEVGAEASLCHHKFAEGESRFGGDYGIAAVGNVGKRTAVHKGRSAFGGLHEVRVEGIFQQHRDSTSHAHVFHIERLVVGSEAKQNVFDASLQILDARSQTHDSHNFRCRGDVETRL